jgi:hypothetical protein
MNKTILVVAGAVIVVGGVLFFLMNNLGESSNEDPNVNTDQPGTPPASTSGQSLRSLLATSGSQRCTFTDSTAAGNTSGTVYLASGRMRGDFEAMTGNITLESHMMSDGEDIYVWSSAMPNQGLKMSLASVSGTDNQSGVSLDEKLNYECAAWTTDQSVFKLPSGITFSALPQLGTPPALGSASGGSGSEACVAQCSSVQSNPAAYQACVQACIQ